MNDWKRTIYFPEPFETIMNIAQKVFTFLWIWHSKFCFSFPTKAYFKLFIPHLPHRCNHIDHGVFAWARMNTYMI